MSDIQPAANQAVTKPARMCACRECGASYPRRAKPSEFCSQACRRIYNNRRAMRGAEIYDLAMEMRFDRKTAKERRTFSHLCTLLGRFNEDDKARGRRSWSSSRRMANINSRVGR
jgi:hypothetical protein